MFINKFVFSPSSFFIHDIVLVETEMNITLLISHKTITDSAYGDYQSRRSAFSLSRDLLIIYTHFFYGSHRHASRDMVRSKRPPLIRKIETMTSQILCIESRKENITTGVVSQALSYRCQSDVRLV
jgi:hypothetical protein